MSRRRRVPFGSLRFRTTLIAVLVIGGVLLVASMVIVSQQRAALIDGVDTAARLRITDLQASFAVGGLPTSIPVPLAEVAFAQISDSRGIVVRSSSNIDGEPLLTKGNLPLRGDRITTLTDAPIGNGPFRVVARRVAVANTRYSLYVGSSLAPVERGVSSLTKTLVAVVPLLLLLVSTLMWTLVGRAMGTLDAIRREVDQMHLEGLGRRVPESGRGDEVDRLARTMNVMLGLLEDSIEAQRRFVANASHELRSPLTGIRAQLEVNLAHPDTANWEQTELEVLGETCRMQRLVDDLLVLANSDAPHSTAVAIAIDLDDVVLVEARRLRVRARIAVDATNVTAVRVVGDPESLSRAVRNLCENAERHARTRVILSLYGVDGMVVFEVRDDGDGVRPGEEERIFERFARSDAARDRDHGGTGLGLAIVRDIIEAHGGTVRVDSNSSGGACFIVRIPSRNEPA